MDNFQILDFDLFGGKKEMPRVTKKQFNENNTRKGALSLARKRLERAYGIKGESNFSADELDELRQIFEFYDIDSSKTMDLSELNMALRALGYTASEEEVSDLASLMDVDGDLSMDFSEFCMIVEYMREEKGIEAELREAFRCIDTNGDGYVTADELLDLMMTQGNTMSLKEASELIRFVDRNGDGMLDYEEFMRIILEGRDMSRSSTFYSSLSFSLLTIKAKEGNTSTAKRDNAETSTNNPSTILKQSKDIESGNAAADLSMFVATTSLSHINLNTNANETNAMEDIATMESSNKIEELRKEFPTSSQKKKSISINVVGPENGQVLGSVVLETRTESTV